MYVCVCEAVTERQVDDVIDRGARSLREVRDSSRAGSSCGTCLREIRRRLRQRGAAPAK